MKRFDWPVRVYYEDTDAGGVVYYANYLKFFERARTEFLRSTGFGQDALMRDPGIVFAVRSITVDYMKPALFNDELLVSSELAVVRRASMLFEQSISRKGGDRALLCRAQVRIACVDVHRMRPSPLPDELFRSLTYDA
jgi:acyl-CoA thioester hydrolase